MLDRPHPHSPSSRLMAFAMAGAALLVAASGWAFYYATAHKRPSGEDQAISIEIGTTNCRPNTLAVEAGRRVFEIRNASARPVEWEILDGVMVVEERENILPGFVQEVIADLKPGTYAITCGLLSNPRGTLTATAPAGAAPATGRPDITAFIAPLAEDKAFLMLQGTRFAASTRALADAIARGELETAREQLLDARSVYLSLAGVTGRWSDLQARIDPAADYLEKREQDEGFVGLQRIEFGLFARQSTDGLSAIASRLVADADDLAARLNALQLAPEDIWRGPILLAKRIVDGRLITNAGPYAHAELAGLEAQMTGVSKAAELLAALLGDGDETLRSSLTDQLAACEDGLVALKDGETYPPIDRVAAAERAKVTASIQSLADAMSRAASHIQAE